MILTPFEVADAVVDYNSMLREQELAKERFVSMISGLEQLSPGERQVVINYLRQDNVIAEYAGSDPERYYENLKESSEIIGAVIASTYAGAIAGAVLAWFLHKYRDSFYALRKTLTNNTAMSDKDMQTETSSRMILSYDAFKQNCTTLENGYRQLNTLLKKANPTDADFYAVAGAVGLKLKRPSRPTPNRIIGGFSLGAFTALGASALISRLVSGPIIGALLVSGYATLPMVLALSFTENFLRNTAGVFLGLRAQSYITDWKSSTIAQGGWTHEKGEWARKQCLALIKYMDNVAIGLQNCKIEDKAALSAVRKIVDLYAATVQGMCISTARLMD